MAHLLKVTTQSQQAKNSAGGSIINFQTAKPQYKDMNIKQLLLNMNRENVDPYNQTTQAARPKLLL
jgi:hypothetical protein